MKNFIIVFLLSIVLFACSTDKEPHSFINHGNIPIIEMVLDEDTVNMIVDSGAEYSIINSDYYKNNLLRFTPMNQMEVMFTGIGGEHTQISDIVWTYTSLGRITFVEHDISAVVKNFPNYNIAGLIGSDFLRQHNYVVDYKVRQIYPYELRDSVYAKINSKNR